MGGIETNIGGTQEAFPDTAWSTILSDLDPASPRRRERLGELVARYWRPVYKFVRTSWGESVEDAKDLTQEFFSRLMDGDPFSGYDPAQGRFRHFLKGVLKHFLANAKRDANALKRGGGKEIVPLDLASVETELFSSERRTLTPDQVFDRQWAHDVLAQAVARLRSALGAAGKTRALRVFDAWIAPGDPGRERPDQETIAGALGISVSDVKNDLRDARARLDALIVEALQDLVVSKEELAAELRELFSG